MIKSTKYLHPSYSLLPIFRSMLKSNKPKSRQWCGTIFVASASFSSIFLFRSIASWQIDLKASWKEDLKGLDAKTHTNTSFLIVCVCVSIIMFELKTHTFSDSKNFLLSQYKIIIMKKKKMWATITTALSKKASE